MTVERAAELPAGRAGIMARELLEIRDAVYDGRFDVATELLTGFRTHMAFLDHELFRLESMIRAALARSGETHGAARHDSP